VAELGAGADDLGQAGGEPAVLDQGPDDPGGQLRAQGAGAAALVGEAVHLLLDDVGGLPDPAGEHGRVLEDGRLDRLVAGQAGLLEHDPLDLGPGPRGRRQVVEGALGGLEAAAHARIPCRNGLVARSRPTVVVGPWPGRTRVSSARGRNRAAREANIWVVSPPGRSVRPIEPANTRSPASSRPGSSPAASGGKVTWPGVWPGVWSTSRRRPASSTTWPSARGRTSAGSVSSSPPKAARASGPNPARGSVSRCRSSGWMKAGMPWAPARGATVQTWSRWPWVSRAATGLRRWRRHSSAMPSRASWPGGHTRAPALRAGVTTP